MNIHTIKQRLANERNVEFTQSAWSQTALILGLLASGPFISLMAYSAPATILTFDILDLGVLQLGFYIPILVTIPAFLSAVLLWRKYDTRYIIGKDHITIIRGVFSSTKKIDEVSFDHIKSFQVKQDIIQRFFDVGDLEIGCISSVQGILSVKGIRQPERLQFMIERRRLLNELSEKQFEVTAQVESTS